jgi:hypothetical protein
MRFFWEQPHKLALQILRALFSIPQTSIHDARKLQQRLAGDVDLRTDELHASSCPNAGLAHSEGRTVMDPIGTKQRANNYMSLCEVRDSANRPLSERVREDIALGKR